MVKTEYFTFLDDLGLHIKTPTKERMFAFADVNGNGSIAIGELESTWQYFKDLMVYRWASEQRRAGPGWFQKLDADLLQPPAAC